jgi:polysaccharide export outer membrane protein
MKTLRMLRGAVWGFCLAAVGCQSNLELVGFPKALIPEDGAAQKALAQRYTEDPRDRARRPWQTEQAPPQPPSPIVPVSAEERPQSSPPIVAALQSKASSTSSAPAKSETPPQELAVLPATAVPARDEPPGSAAGEQSGASQVRPLPTELAMESHPPYVIEPPDVLLIDTIQMIPRSPYTVQALDVLLLRATNTLPNQPIDGAYTVSPDGRLNLGFSYGSVRVAGLSVEKAEEAVRAHLEKILAKPQIAVSLGQFRGVQQVRGEHLVKADGTISLGTYGSVYVTGLTLYHAKLAIEHHLARFVQDPEVSVDVFAFNSKAYYVIADGGGYGQIVLRFPITGKETVLDAIGQIQGLPAVSSQRRIWVARPAPADHCCLQILPVDWQAIVQGGSTATNYQLFPGDRVYVKADCLITIDNWLAKALAPVERLFGITLLGTATVRTIEGNNLHNGAVIIP